MKRVIFTLLLLTLLISPVIAEVTNKINSTLVSNNNPITNFFEKETSADFLKYLGTPTTLSYQKLFVYLLVSLILFILIKDILANTNLFDQIWITYSISFIVLLLGISTGTLYKILMSIIPFGSDKPAIAIGILIVVLVVLTIIFKILEKQKPRRIKEKRREIAEKERTLHKVKNIEMKAAGIE